MTRLGTQGAAVHGAEAAGGGHRGRLRRHTLLPLDDCRYALPATIPHLTRSAFHRLLQRHGISRLPEVDGDKPGKQDFKTYPVGFFHIEIAEVRTEEGKLHLFVAVDRLSKLVFTQLHATADRPTACGFLEADCSLTL